MTSTTVDTKKRKLEEGGGDSEIADSKTMSQAGTHTDSTSVLKDFRLKKVLREDPRSKLITLHGTLNMGSHTGAEAVVLLERKPFDGSTIEESVRQTVTKEILQNDIYSTHEGFSSDAAPDLKATIICPATEKHISKYTEHEPFLIRETPELYATVTEPCMAQSKFSIQWVYNILEKQTESERIIAEDPDPELGFVLLPDLKWDTKTVDQLYMVAIAHKHGIKSLRDLSTQDLPLLENIRDKGLTAIKEKFGLPAHQVRVYFHYRPSYYHLHVHFTSLRMENPPGSDILRAHLLDDVIENIRSYPEFYRNKTFSYVVREGDELYRWYKDAGYFSKDENSSQDEASMEAKSTDQNK